MSGPSSIVLIAGPPGAGKSTAAKALVATASGPAAYIEGDTFWRFIIKPAPDRPHRTVIRAMIAAAVPYARDGFETVLDFSIGPWFLERLRPAFRDAPVDFVVLCPSEAVCARRAAGRDEGKMPDYGPYRDLHAAFCDIGAYERHAIRDDEADPAVLAARIRTGLTAGAFRISWPA